MKAKLVRIIVPLLALGTLAACGTGGSDSITITVWEDQSNITMMEELAKEYVANYKKTYPSAPTLTINFQSQSEKSAISKMLNVAEAGEGPDIAAVTHDTISTGAYEKVIAPASYSQALEYRMTDDAISAVSVDGVVYGYPITAESMTVMYDNTKVTAAEISSMEALAASGKKLAWCMTGDDGGYYTFGLYTDSILFGADGTDASKIDIATTESVSNVYSFFHDDAGAIKTATPEEAVAYVEQNIDNVVGLVSSPFILASMKASLGNKLGIAKLPTINGTNERPFSGYKAYVVNAYTKNGALAQDIANFFTSYDANAWRLSQNGYLPAVPLDSTDDIKELMEASPSAQVFASSLEDSRLMPTITKAASLWQPLNNATSYFWTNKSTITTEVVRTKLQEITDALKA